MTGIRGKYLNHMPQGYITENHKFIYPVGQKVIVLERPAVITGYAPKRLKFDFTDTKQPAKGQAVPDRVRRVV